MDEEDAKIAQQNEKRFKELIAIANKCTNPLSIKNNNKTTTTERRKVNIHQDESTNNHILEARKAQDDDILSDDNDSQRASGAGLGFAPAKSSMQTHGSGAGIGGGSSAGLGLGMSAPQQHYRVGIGGGSSAGLGLGMSTQHAEETSIDMNQTSPGLGMGLGANTSNFSLSQTMAMGLGSNMNDKPMTKKRDPSLGKWEKHTKGIGMKLLQKMGYEGSGGLGAKRKRKPIETSKTDDDRIKSGSMGTKETDESKEEGVRKRGISRPVEVVVRPMGLGLGYGSFKEQSQLKVNRQIEAEVRGLQPSKEEEEEKTQKKDTILEGIPKSLLPSTQSLLDKGANSWRAGGKGNKKTKRKIVNYQDILNKSDVGDGEGKTNIIDMRGPSVSVPRDASQSSKSAVVPLGEELLHNVTLLLNTHESQLRTSAYMQNSTKRKIASLEEECNDMIKRKEGIDGRITKMKFAIEVLDEAEKLIESVDTMKTDNACDAIDIAMEGLRNILFRLYDNFSKEERKSLNFDSTLIPSIVQPVIEAVTSSMDPLSINSTWMNHLANGIDKLCVAVGSDNEAYSIREIIFADSILPWITSAMSSSTWDPVVNVDVGINIHEALLACVDQSFLGAEVAENNILKRIVHGEIIENVVQPKLQRAVSYWKPKLDKNNVISNPMHQWILPWLPHFKNESMMGTMFADIRRCLKKTLSFISKHEPSDITFFSSCIAVLSPWQKLFEASTIFGLTSESVTPRFARSLAKMSIEFSKQEQNWDKVTALMNYFNADLMSSDDFLSLVEGEILASWVYTLHSALENKPPNLSTTSKFYYAWKERLFGHPSNSSKSHVSLQGDLMVCRYFFGGLEMIKASIESNRAKLESLTPPHPKDCNYRIALMHRSKQKKTTHTETKDVSLPSQPKPHSNVASFTEVVADFARQHDIDFYPKVGSNSMKDGKKIYLFGNHSIFFDKNVLFALRGTKWQPISLEHLAQAC